MAAFSPALTASAHGQDPFGAVEAYLAQAQAEIGRAFLELAEPATPVGATEKQGHLQVKIEDPCPAYLDELSAWADRLAKDLDAVLICQEPDSDQLSTEQVTDGPTVQPPPSHTGDTSLTSYKTSLPVKFSSLPTRSGQECQRRVSAGLSSSSRRHRRRSWPPDTQRPLWEDRRIKRQLTRDASVQTNPREFEVEPNNRLISRISARSGPLLKMEAACASGTTEESGRVFAYKNHYPNGEDLPVVKEDENLVLPSQQTFTAKQALKVQTSSVRNKPKPKIASDSRTQITADETQRVTKDKWLECIMWCGSPYARIYQWKAEDEDNFFLERKDLPKSGTQEMDTSVDAAISSLVSRHELESFLRKVEKSTYRPPSTIDCTGLQDASTQTSEEFNLSCRMTWGSEDCDCVSPATCGTRWRLSGYRGQSSTSSLLSSSTSSSSPPPCSSSSSLSDSPSSSGILLDRRSPAPLANKSASAPMLRPQEDIQGRSTNKAQPRGPLRSHSDRQLTELEAVEACVWLRAAGFPQYAQMYEDNQFPIDIGSVRKDHNFLDPDAIYSLFRRLNTLNKCARLKNSDFPRKAGEEDDSDDQCALSENWQYQQGQKRWSRVVLTVPNPAEGHTTPPRSPLIGHGCAAHSEDSVFTDEHFLIVPQRPSPETVRQHTSHCHTKGNLLAVMTMEADTCLECMEHSHSSLSPHDRSAVDALRRSGSERLKDSARALLRRVESLKGKRKKNREVVIIGGPAGDNKATIVTSSGNQLLTPEVRDPDMDSPDLSGGSSSMGGTPLIKQRKGIWLPSSSDNSSSFSDSECVNTLTLPVGDRKRRNEGGSSSSLEEPNNNIRRRNPSFKRSQKDSTLNNRTSIYDNVPSSKEDNRITQTDSSQESVSGLAAPSFQDALELVAQQQHGDSNQQRRDSGVGASLTRQFSSSLTSSSSCWHCFPPQSMNNAPPPFRIGSPVSALSVHQCNLLRKVSFLKATTVADKHCPAGKHANWNWGVTKILKKMKQPDYKDKTVFGVPLSMVVQRNGGQPLPPPIQTALCHLHATALDAQGIFRKSGVRSRIQRLRQQCETHGTLLSQQAMQNAYEQQQAYDVADLVKQYFREVPDSLLTAKQSEILINVYQYVPEEERLSALRMCILYLPDENREALQCLLHLLHQVALNSEVNQMSASNLGVCLAPSLFQLGSSGPGSSPYSRSSSSSPRRRRNTTRENSGNNHNNTLGPGMGSGGMPDQRELDQSRAAHNCLTDMIHYYRKIFLVPEEAGSYQRVSCLDQPWDPISMDDMGSQWQSFTEQAFQDMIKECHDKSRLNGSWSSVSLSIGGAPSPWEGVEVWHRKVGDGHPLKLWKVCVEIEGPPADILHRILNERYLWDMWYVEGRVLSELDSQSDVYLSWQSSVLPHPLRQFCLLRSWKQEKTYCVLVEASVDHPDASPLPTFPEQEEEVQDEEMQEEPELVVGSVVLASRYLLEPCGAGRTRVTHISRTDLRGRSIEWYNSFYGHQCANLVSRLRDSFKQGTVGPETKV